MPCLMIRPFGGALLPRGGGFEWGVLHRYRYVAEGRMKMALEMKSGVPDTGNNLQRPACEALGWNLAPD